MFQTVGVFWWCDRQREKHYHKGIWEPSKEFRVDSQNTSAYKTIPHRNYLSNTWPWVAIWPPRIPLDPHQGKEVTLYVDFEPFHFYAKIEENNNKIQQILSNDISFHSFSYIDPFMVPSTSTKTTPIEQWKIETKLQVLEKGNGNYHFNQAFYIGMLPPTPKVYGGLKEIKYA